MAGGNKTTKRTLHGVRSRSSRAGLQFPVGRIHRFLRKGENEIDNHIFFLHIKNKVVVALYLPVVSWYMYFLTGKNMRILIYTKFYPIALGC